MVDQRGSGSTDWRMGSYAVWRSPVTWRRVLRTITSGTLGENANFGTLPLGEGGGAKHSPPGTGGTHTRTCGIQGDTRYMGTLGT